MTEEHDIFNATTVFFRAGEPSTGPSGSQWHHVPNRRTASVGPGLILDIEEDEHEHESRSSNEQGHDAATQHTPPPSFLSRRLSMDHHNLQNHFVSHHVGVPMSQSQSPALDAPTPPYSPSPIMTHRPESYLSTGSSTLISPRIAEEPSVDGTDVAGTGTVNSTTGIGTNVGTEHDVTIHSPGPGASSFPSPSFCDLKFLCGYSSRD